MTPGSASRSAAAPTLLTERRSACLVLVLMILVSCLPFGSSLHADVELAIPRQSDWTDYGPIFEAGDLDEWDHYLWGGFAGTAVKKGGTYFLYYQGASDYRTSHDETVLWRAIGVATSPDGVSFRKYEGNPVVTWFPNDNGEEGAVSGSVALDDSGELVFLYGANTQQSVTRVNADARRARSTDGLTFTDMGIVLDHRDRSIWGSGDELFPIIAIHDLGQWFVYYLSNGTLQARRLGVAWGPRLDDIVHSSAVRAGGRMIKAWGMGGAAKVGQGVYALFLNDVPKRQTEVRLVSLSSPDHLSTPVETYRFDEVVQATVLLDEETRTWFMYYRGEDMYGVKLAPAGEPDATPPAASETLTTAGVSDRQVDLAWRPVQDPETGIVVYKDFRDRAYVDTVKGWSYNDMGLVAGAECCYEVSAVNHRAVVGPRSPPVTVTTSIGETPVSLYAEDGTATGIPGLFLCGEDSISGARSFGLALSRVPYLGAAPSRRMR